MHVLHVNNEKTWRGGERQTLITAREQRRAGIEVSIACRNNGLLEKAARDEHISTIPLPIAAPATVLKLNRIISRFDIIHCHAARAHSLVTLAKPLKTKPVIVSRRVDFLPAHNWFNRLKYRRAAKVVCVSHFIAKQMQGWGVPSERLEVIYDSAETDQSWRSKEECRKELSQRISLPKARHIVGNIAALAGHKDHATLLRAAKAL